MPRRRKLSGATIVEFAIVLPIVMLIVFGSIELARMNMLRNATIHASYAGARAAMVPGATAENARQAVAARLRPFGGGTADVTITPSVLTENTKDITVTVSVSISEWSWLIPRFSDGLIISQSCHLTREPSQSGF